MELRFTPYTPEFTRLRCQAIVRLAEEDLRIVPQCALNRYAVSSNPPSILHLLTDQTSDVVDFETPPLDPDALRRAAAAQEATVASSASIEPLPTEEFQKAPRR